MSHLKNGSSYLVPYHTAGDDSPQYLTAETYCARNNIRADDAAQVLGSAAALVASKRGVRVPQTKDALSRHVDAYPVVLLDEIARDLGLVLCFPRRGDFMSVLSTLTKGTQRAITRRVTLKGTTPIMFDRYAGDNNTELAPWQRAYYLSDGITFCIPAKNIMSFLSATNTNSAPRRLLETRHYKKTAMACLAYVSLSPFLVPLCREDDGEPIVLGEPNGDHDAKSGAYIDRAVARLDKGIPNAKARPVVPLPWSLQFELTLQPNDEIQEQQLCHLFIEGGRAVGLGTWRGVYGKFEVVAWDEIE